MPVRFASKRVSTTFIKLPHTLPQITFFSLPSAVRIEILRYQDAIYQMDSNTILQTTSFLGFTSSIWLSGIYYSQSHLTIPLLYDLAEDTSASIFQDLYHSGAKLIVPIVLTSVLSSGTSAYLDSEKRVPYAIAALATIGTLIWTRTVMMGGIERLIALAKNEPRLREKMQPGEVVELLKQWRWMNMVRAALAGIGGIVGLLGASGIL
ncbi:hypothetical protein LTR67_006842 [Exophiala xenobiotica]